MRRREDWHSSPDDGHADSRKAMTMAKRINNGRMTAWVSKSEATIDVDGEATYAVRWERMGGPRGQWSIFRLTGDPHRPLAPEREGTSPTLKGAVNWMLGL